MPGYGTLKSSVSAAYQSGPGPLVWFIGFNGAFNQQIVLKSYPGARVLNVSAGPHGGVAECASSSALTFCQWSTDLDGGRSDHQGFVHSRRPRVDRDRGQPDDQDAQQRGASRVTPGGLA